MSASRCALLFFASCAVMQTVPSFSQVSTASINGTIRDSSGSVVPEAVIVLHNQQTNVEMRTVSNSTGHYAFLNVPVGAYSVEVSKPGFSKRRLEEFTLVVNQTATLDFTLALGLIEQSITVEAIGDAVQSSTAELGVAVATKNVQELPLNGRNFTQLLSLAPGMSPVNVSSGASGSGSAPVGAFLSPTVNGQTGRSNFYMMEGFTMWGAGPPVFMPSRRFSTLSRNSRSSPTTIRPSSGQSRAESLNLDYAHNCPRQAADGLI